MRAQRAPYILVDPTPRVPEYFHHFRLFRVSIFGPEFTIILPPRLGRHSHQDILSHDARRRKPKFGASVDDEVELDGATASEELPPPLGRHDRLTHLSLQDRYKRRQKAIPEGDDEVKQGFPSAQTRKRVLGRRHRDSDSAEQHTHRVRIHVVEPDAADPAVFVSVRDVEVVVAGGFEGRVDGDGGVRGVGPGVTGGFQGAVKVTKVVFVDVGWG